MKTKSKFALLGFFSLALNGGWNLASGHAQMEKLRVAYSAISPTQLHGVIPLEAGFYKKNGLDVELILFSGAPLAVSAMIAGETPIIQAAAVGVVNSQINGSDAVLLTGAINRFPYQLYVDKTILRIQDLKGKKFGIARIGAGDHSSATIVLKNQGLDPKDLTFVQVGSVPTRLAALIGGSIQATLLIPPETLQGKEAGFRMLLDFTELDVEYQHTGIATTRAFIKKKPDIVRRFVKSYVEGVHYILTNPVGTKKIMRKFLKAKSDAAIDETYDGLVLKVTRRVPYPTDQGIQVILDQLKATVPAAAKARPEDFTDTSFLKQLEGSGYIASMYRNAEGIR